MLTSSAVVTICVSTRGRGLQFDENSDVFFRLEDQLLLRKSLNDPPEFLVDSGGDWSLEALVAEEFVDEFDVKPDEES